MKNILSNYMMVALLTFAVIMAVLGRANAKEMKMQESSYAPVMITKSFEAVRAMDVAEKAEVMSKHMTLLRERYDLSEKTDLNATMSGGKPLPVGPTARLRNGITWEGLGLLSPEEIKQKGWFPISSTAACQACYRWNGCGANAIGNTP